MTQQERYRRGQANARAVLKALAEERRNRYRSPIQPAPETRPQAPDKEPK
jgi:hypothetical protein